MREVIDDVARTREKAARLQTQLSSRLKLSEDLPPLDGLAMAFNHATLALELLTYYFNLWAPARQLSQRAIDEARAENAARVLEITKSMFILTLSAFEFCAKRSVATSPNRLSVPKGRLYLSGIIDSSRAAKVIDPGTAALWQGAIKIRNTLVHNNGIAEVSTTYEFPTVRIVMLKNQMTQGNLRVFALLNEWCVETFAAWCGAWLLASPAP